MSEDSNKDPEEDQADNNELRPDPSDQSAQKKPPADDQSLPVESPVSKPAEVSPSQQPPQPTQLSTPSEETPAPKVDHAAASKIVERPITRTPPAPPASGEDDDSMNRRSFMIWLVLGWSAFAAIIGGYGALMLRFFFPNVLFEPKQSFRAGFPDDFTVGEVSEKFKEKQATWIVRESDRIYALSTVCTHLGCTPNWLSNENKFKCPCHGSGFYKTGINFEGPAPRPLERFKIYLAEDGEIVVDKTKKFQQEKGEWKDPESFISV